MTHLTVFRVTRRDYATDTMQLLDGEGGRRVGGRWHLRGSPVAYFGSSRALCMLERLVHLSVHPREDDAELVAAKLVIPEVLTTPAHIRRLSAEDLDSVDASWRQEANRTCLRIGVRWFRDNQHFALQVPSAIIPDEPNVVINCTHPVARELVATADFSVRPISIDPRIAEIISQEALRVRRRR